MLDLFLTLETIIFRLKLKIEIINSTSNSQETLCFRDGQATRCHRKFVNNVKLDDEIQTFSGKLQIQSTIYSKYTASRQVVVEMEKWWFQHFEMRKINKTNVKCKHENSICFPNETMSINLSYCTNGKIFNFYTCLCTSKLPNIEIA